MLPSVSATPPQPAFAAIEGFYGEGNGEVVHVTCAGTCLLCIYAMSVSVMISTVRQRAVNILQGTALDLHKL